MPDRGLGGFGLAAQQTGRGTPSCPRRAAARPGTAEGRVNALLAAVPAGRPARRRSCRATCPAGGPRAAAGARRRGTWRSRARASSCRPAGGGGRGPWPPSWACRRAGSSPTLATRIDAGAKPSPTPWSPRLLASPASPGRRRGRLRRPLPRSTTARSCSTGGRRTTSGVAPGDEVRLSLPGHGAGGRAGDPAGGVPAARSGRDGGPRARTAPSLPRSRASTSRRTWPRGIRPSRSTCRSIRPQDEEYWDDYRAGAQGVRLRGDRPPPVGDPLRRRDRRALRGAGHRAGHGAAAAALAVRRNRRSPPDRSRRLRPRVPAGQAEGLAAAEGSTDFGGLFLAFSFFLIVSAVLLVGLLFRLAVERRAGELGLLLAVGYPVRRGAPSAARRGWAAGRRRSPPRSPRRSWAMRRC